MTTTDNDLLAALRGPATLPISSRVHDRFVARATNEGLVDVAYRTIDTRIGELLLAASPTGLMRIAFALEGFDAVLAELAELVSPRVLRAPAPLDAAARQIDEYLDGRLVRFDLPLDLRLAHGFRREVLEHLCTIPYGRTESYTEAATAAGRPAAVRAAAGACSHNPIPLVVPCHRIVRRDGSFGEYRGGPEIKRDLLQMEALT
jgi:methylated-DNA-[protein]-cysteine S-methyltransferase